MISPENANGMDGTSDHREAMYDSGGQVVFDHDTMFVAPEDTPQVASSTAAASASRIAYWRLPVPAGRPAAGAAA